jgi:hypothetical protein
MRKRVRLATAAGLTALGFTAMSGVAQADTGGGLVSGLTGSLAKTGPVGETVDGVVNQATGSSSSGHSGVHLSVPVDLGLGSSRSSGHSAPAVKAHVKAGVKASVAPVAVRARVNARLCAGAPAQCGERAPSPPIPIPPAPPTPPPTPPIGTQPPGGTGSGTQAQSANSLTIGGGSLPFTGGPLGTLALLGAAAVVTGAGGVAASRLRTNRG